MRSYRNLLGRATIQGRQKMLADVEDCATIYPKSSGVHLAGGHAGDAGQLEVLLPHVQPLGALCRVPLRQLPALLVLDDREQPERPVVACTMFNSYV